MLLFWIVCLGLSLLLSGLAYKNAFPISIDLWPFGYHLHIMLPLVVLLSFIAGLLIGAILMATNGLFRKKKKTSSFGEDVKII